MSVSHSSMGNIESTNSPQTTWSLYGEGPSAPRDPYSSRLGKVELEGRCSAQVIRNHHVGTNSLHSPECHHLHTIGRTDTQRCPGCGASKEPGPHFVLRCPKYALQRRVFMGPLGRNGGPLDYLLSSKEGTDRLFKFSTRSDGYTARLRTQRR